MSVQAVGARESPRTRLPVPHAEPGSANIARGGRIACCTCIVTVADPSASLVGTPYLLPEDVASSEQIEALTNQEADITRRLQDVRKKLSSMNLRETSNVQVTREIFESNQIEGLGPDLSGTWDALRSEQATAMMETIDQELMHRCIAGDTDMRAVLTLHGARLLAKQLQDDIAAGRPLTEADLRGIHSVICADEGHEGGYKRYHVMIGGEDAHEPHLPIAVNASMYELVEWFRDSDRGSGVLRAAAAHGRYRHASGGSCFR
jgi:Fic family protein